MKIKFKHQRRFLEIMAKRLKNKSKCPKN